MANKTITLRKGTQQWAFFEYLKNHEFVSSRDSKYPPLEIMDLPKVVSVLRNQEHINIDIKNKKYKNKYGVTKRYVEYRLIDNVEVIEF